MWPAIAGVLFTLVVLLGAYLWLQPTQIVAPTTVVYEDDWASGGWWPWIPNRYPHRPHRPVPHHPPQHWLGPGGTEWPRPPRLGAGGMARPHPSSG